MKLSAKIFITVIITALVLLSIKIFLYISSQPSTKTSLAEDFKNRNKWGKIEQKFYSPEIRQIIYVAKQGEEVYVCTSDHRIGPFQEVGQVKVSPDGTHIGLLVRYSNEREAILNYELSSRKPTIIAESSSELQDYSLFDFSPTSTIAFISVEYNSAEKKTKTSKSYYFHFGKTTIGPYAVIGQIFWSPDGKKYAFNTCKQAHQRDCDMLVYGSSGELISNLGNNVDSVAFTPEGLIGAYSVTTGYLQTHVVIGEEQQPIYNTINHLEITKSGKVIYSARNGETERVVINGKEEKSYDSISDIVVSPDGNSIAYIVCDYKPQSSHREYCQVVQDGIESKKQFDDITSISFSPDGTKLAYLATNFYGKTLTNLIFNSARKLSGNDEMVTSFVGLSTMLLMDPLMTSKHVVVNDKMIKSSVKPYALFDRIRGITFSPDSQKISYKMGLFEETITLNK